MTNQKNVILLIDNYDSFTFNIFQQISKLINSENDEIIVKRNDEISLKKVLNLNLKIIKLIISPGPGNILKNILKMTKIRLSFKFWLL